MISRMRSEGTPGSVVTLVCDRGDRYADTYYSDDWIRSRHIDLEAQQRVIATFLSTGAWPNGPEDQTTFNAVMTHPTTEDTPTDPLREKIRTYTTSVEVEVLHRQNQSVLTSAERMALALRVARSTSARRSGINGGGPVSLIWPHRDGADSGGGRNTQRSASLVGGVVVALGRVATTLCAGGAGGLAAANPVGLLATCWEAEDHAAP